MPADTPNHGFPNPEYLAENWHEDWYHAFTDLLDAKVTTRDIEANLAEKTPYAGARFIATDTGAVYDGDGSVWNLASRGLDSLTVNGLLSLPPQNVLNITGAQGDLAFHDGTDGANINPAHPVYHDGVDWRSIVSDAVIG